MTRRLLLCLFALLALAGTAHADEPLRLTISGANEGAVPVAVVPFAHEGAGLPPSVTMRWEPVRIAGGPGSGLSPTDRHLAAKARFDGAMAAAGKGLADVLWRVVCACESVPHAERALEWPARSGKLVLRLALDRVADFYRLPG